MRRFASVLLSLLLATMLAGGGVVPAATPALASDGVVVSINAPEYVAPGENFTATVNITGVQNFDAADYRISFDPTVLQLVGANVTPGPIGATVIPVDFYNEVSSGTYTIAQNIPGLNGASGSGVLAVLHFRAVGASGASSSISLSNGTLSDNTSTEIPATWMGTAVSLGIPAPTWSPMTSGTSVLLRGVWGTSDNNVFAVGSSGKTLHYDGVTWSSMSAPDAPYLLRDIWGTSGNDVFAVGGTATADAGRILHYDGTGWSVSTNSTYFLGGVWGSSSSDVFAVGGIVASNDGRILHYNGTGWSQNASTNDFLDGVWGSSGSNVFAVGGFGIERYNGTSWARTNVSEIVYDVWGSSGSNVIVVGDAGTILRYNGSTWSPMTSGTSKQLMGVWGSSASDVFAVGFDGTILHYDGVTWSSMTSGTTQHLYDIWSTSNTSAFAVGANGTILRLSLPPAPPPAALHHFDFGFVDNQTAGVPFPVTITAKNSNNNTVNAFYTGNNTLSDSTGTISPTQTGNFTNSVWTGNVTIYQASQGGVITTSGGGAVGFSNPFNVAGAGPAGDFSLNLIPGYLSFLPGGSANVTVTIQSTNDFASEVTLSAYTPYGISYAFNPASVTPSANGQVSTNMTVSVAEWVPPEVYYIGVEGQSLTPPIIRSQNLMLNVMPPAAWGPSISLSQSYGQPGDNITVTGVNFINSVGQVVTFREVFTNTLIPTAPSPILVGPGGAFFASGIVPNVPLGNYRLEARVSATGEFAEKDFQVLGAQSSFIISASPWSTSVVTEAGKNSSNVSISLFSIGSSNTTVALSVVNPPGWLTYRFGNLADNTPAAGGNAIAIPIGGSKSVNLRLTAGLSAPTGNFYVMVKAEAVNPGEVQFVEIELIVMPPAGYGMAGISLSPSVGGVGSTVTVSGWGFTPNSNIVQLMFGGMNQLAAPVAVSATGSFSTQFIVPGWAMGGGMYPIDVIDSSGMWGGAQFMVTAVGQKFSLSVNPDWLPPIEPGDNATTMVTVESMGAAANVTLSMDRIPPGVVWEFSASPGNVTITLQVPPGGKKSAVLMLKPVNIPPGGPYGAEIRGEDQDGNTLFAHVDFNVGGGGFMGKDWMSQQNIWFPDLVLNPNKGKVGAKVTVAGSNFPPGANVTHLRFGGDAQSIPGNIVVDQSGGFTVVFNVPATVWGGMPTYQGWYPVEVEAHKPGDPFPIFAMKDFEVVAADAAFTMMADPGWLPPIEQGDNRTTVIWVESLGAAANVTLSIEKIPPGVAWEFSASPGGNTTITLNVLAGGKKSAVLMLKPVNIPPGFYGAEIKGRDGLGNEFYTHVDFQVGAGGFMGKDWMFQQNIWFPDLMLNPDIGKVGAKVTVAGSNFPPGANVTHLRFGGDAQPIPGNIVVDQSGGFTVVFNVPATVWGGMTTFEGWYPVEVEAHKPGDPFPIFAMKMFEVVAADAAFTMMADPGWLPPIEQGDNATTVIWVKSMGAAANVTLSMDKIPPGVAWEFSASPGGNVTITLAVPAGGKKSAVLMLKPVNIPPGFYGAEIKGRDGLGNEFYTHVDFQVGAGGFMGKDWMFQQNIWFPDLMLNPDIGKVGAKVTVAGSNFPPGANVTHLRFGGDAQPIPGNIVVDQSGGFTVVFNVPATVWGGMTTFEGWYPVEVEAHKPGDPFPIFAMKMFEVVAADAAFTMMADPGWLPPIEQGDNATTVIWVKSMGAAANVTLSMDKIPPGVAWEFSASPGGNVTITLNVPAGGKKSAVLMLKPVNIPPGFYGAEIKGRDGLGNEFYTHVDFQVAPQASFKNTNWMQQSNVWFPEFTLNPDAGKVGSKVTGVGEDFPAGANVTGLWFAGISLPIPAVNADENGDFTLIFNVPKTLGTGYYMVEIEAEKPGMFPVFIAKPFEITSQEEIPFKMEAVPDWVSDIEQGTSVNTTVFVESVAGAVTVHLSVDGLPLGATAQFSPSGNVTVSPGGTSSRTLTITTSAWTPPGRYWLSIEGVSGNSTGFTRVIDFSFGVMMSADFNIPALTIDPTFAPAGYGNKKMKITFSGTGFPASETVYLTFGGDNVTLPPGFSTDINGNFNGVFQLPAGLDAGTYMVGATAGGVGDSKPFTIKAVGSTFIIKPSPPSVPPIRQGASGNATVTVKSVGTTNSTVTLSIDGLPVGVSAVFSPSNTVTASPGSSTSAIVVINVGAGILPGLYSVSILGVSGNETNSVPFGFSVMTDIGEGEGYATITISPPGGNPGTHITATGAGFTANRTITLTATPMGAEEAPVNITAGNITVQAGGIWSTLFTIPSVDPGLYIVKATDGIVSAETKLHVVPEKAKAFTLDLSPSYLKVVRGGSGNVTLKLNSLNKFKDTIKFGVGGLPLGVTLTYIGAKGNILGKYAGSPAGGVTTIVTADNVTPVPGESTAVTVLLAVDAGTPLGPYFVPLEVSDNSTVVEVLNLVVIPAEANLILSPNSGTSDTTIGFSGSGFADNETVNMTFSSDNIINITTIPSPLRTITGGNFTGMITVPNVEAGIHRITATGAISNTSVEASFVVKPSAADTFALSAKPKQLAVPKNGSGSFTITVEPSGSFNSIVSLALTGLDSVSANATSNWTPASGNITPSVGIPVSASLKITNLNDAAEGKYPLTVTGTSGNITQVVKLSLHVIPATPDFSITLAPAAVTIKAGASGNTTVSVAALNSFNGTVSLSVSSLPAGISYNATGNNITVSATSGTGIGKHTIIFTIADNVAPGSWSANITGTSGALVHTANITIIRVPANVTTSIRSSPLVDPTTISTLTPLSVTTSRGDVVTFTGIIPEAPQTLSVITEDVNTLPATLGTIPVNYADGRGYVTNVDTSAPVSGVTWQFKFSYAPSLLATAGINPNKLYAAYLSSGTGQWVVENSVVLRPVSSASNVTANSTFTVDIQVEAGSQPVSGVSAFINFNTTYLSVDNVTANTSALPITLGNIVIDNVTGQVAYSAGTLGSPPTGTFTIATITFRGKAGTATLPISFNRAGARFTDVRYGSGSVLDVMFDLDNHVTITNLSHLSAWTLLGRLAEEVLVIRLVPSSTTVIRGSEFTVDIQVEAGVKLVQGASAFINFDPTYMIVTSITANKTALTLELPGTEWNNESGTANYSAGKLTGTLPTGTFTIATITFRCQQESDNATISFNTQSPRKTDVRYGAGSILGAAIGTTINQVYDAPLRLQPADNQGIVEGQEFTLTLQVNAADNQSVTGAEVYIDFEPAYLEVVGITAIKSALTLEMPGTSYNNTSGQLQYAAGKIGGTPPTGTFTIATITFRAKEKVAATSVNISVTGSRKSLVRFGAGGVYGAHTDARVEVIEGGVVTIKVKLQGDDRTTAQLTVPLMVKLFDTSVNLTWQNIVTKMYGESSTNFTTSDWGATGGGSMNITAKDASVGVKQVTLQIPGVIPGTYQLAITSPHNLINLRNNVVVAAEGVSVNMSELQEGNGDDSWKIDMTDFGLLAVAFLSLSGGPGWNARADYDNNLMINIADFTILAMNFNKNSPIAVP